MVKSFNAANKIIKYELMLISPGTDPYNKIVSRIEYDFEKDNSNKNITTKTETLPIKKYLLKFKSTSTSNGIRSID